MGRHSQYTIPRSTAVAASATEEPTQEIHPRLDDDGTTPAWDNDDGLWPDEGERLNLDQKPSRRLVVLAALHLIIFIPSLLLAGYLFGGGFTEDPEPVTVVKTVTEAEVPQACVDALATASDAYEFTTAYNAEQLQPLPTKDNGVHYFTGSHGMGHYQPLRQFGRDLHASEKTFSRHLKLCRATGGAS